MAAPCSTTGASVLVGLILALLVGIHCDDDFEGSRTLQVEHTFDSGPAPMYSRRGTIVIHSLKNNKAQMTQSPPLTQEDRDKLTRLASDEGLYRLRIPVTKGGNTDVTGYVTTFTKACAMYESGLRDRLTVNFDQSGEVLGVSVHPVPGTCTGSIVDAANLTNWKTVVEVVQTVAGPTPDTQTYIEKMKRDAMERAKGQQGDNRSFFGKYWMYIVPFVIMMMIMSNQDPQAGGGGGGNGGGGGGGR